MGVDSVPGKYLFIDSGSKWNVEQNKKPFVTFLCIVIKQFLLHNNVTQALLEKSVERTKFQKLHC